MLIRVVNNMIPHALKHVTTHDSCSFTHIEFLLGIIEL